MACIIHLRLDLQNVLQIYETRWNENFNLSKVGV